MKIQSHLCSIMLFSALTFSGSAAAQSPPSNLREEPQASNLAIPLPAVQQGIRSRLAELTIDQKTISTTQTAYDGCGLHGIQQRLGDHASTFFHGVRSLPRNAIRVENLKWEFPVMATTVLLIEKGDIPAADRIKSRSLVDNSDCRASLSGEEMGEVGRLRACNRGKRLARAGQASFPFRYRDWWSTWLCDRSLRC